MSHVHPGASDATETTGEAVQLPQAQYPNNVLNFMRQPEYFVNSLRASLAAGSALTCVWFLLLLVR